MTENNVNTSPNTPRTKSKRKSDLGADPKDLTDPPVLTPIPKQPRRSYSLYKKLEYIRIPSLALTEPLLVTMHW